MAVAGLSDSPGVVRAPAFDPQLTPRHPIETGLGRIDYRASFVRSLKACGFGRAGDRRAERLPAAAFNRWTAPSLNGPAGGPHPSQSQNRGGLQRFRQG